LFAAETCKEYNLHYIGYGGAMNDGIKELDVSFITYNKMTIDEARKIEVLSTEKLLRMFNNNIKIRPYLKSYPFNVNNVQISISARTLKDTRPLDGSVAFIFTARNRVFYRQAELVKRKSIPRISMDGKPLPSYMTEARETVDEELVPLYEEPYEEALKIVRENPTCLNDSKDASTKQEPPKPAYLRSLQKTLDELKEQRGFYGY
jgi:hypothetical protein